MAFAPLVLYGTLTIDGTDVSEQVKSFRFFGDRETVEIPAAFGTDYSYAAGPARWGVEVEYMSDTDATAVTQLFWTAMLTDTATVTLTGTVREGAVSATNPKWTGVAVVSTWGLGGSNGELGLESATFQLIAQPTQSTS